ncbi:hypothetical protein YC2023_082560 [Brassica napus]
MKVDEATEGRRLRKRNEKIPKNLKREANEKEMDGFTKRVLRIPVEKPFDEVYYTHRLWMFFRETRETEEDIRRMFHHVRERMKLRITLKKKSDPGKFAIPCVVKGIEFSHALCDTGASVSILPKVMADQLCDNPPFGIKWPREKKSESGAEYLGRRLVEHQLGGRTAGGKDRSANFEERGGRRIVREGTMSRISCSTIVRRCLRLIRRKFWKHNIFGSTTFQKLDVFEDRLGSGMGIKQDGKQARRENPKSGKNSNFGIMKFFEEAGDSGNIFHQGQKYFGLIRTGAEKYSELIAGGKYAGRVKNRVNRPRSSRCLYPYGQDLEVSQYLRSAHSNRHAGGRVSRRMHSSHAASHLDMSGVLLHVCETCLTTCVQHVSPRMRSEACGLTHSRSGGAILLVEEDRILPIERMNTKSPGPKLECCVVLVYCVELVLLCCVGGYGTLESVLAPRYGVISDRVMIVRIVRDPFS